MIRLAKPYISDQTIKEVVKVFNSGNLVQGEYVKKFENALRDYLNVKNAIVVSSGTAALHLALLALKVKKMDEVIIPALTFPATANVVILAGAKPIFIDITPSDFCIDTHKIEEKITKKTKVIVPVHEFGQPAKMDDIINISKRYKLKIIEDAACALGAEFKNKKVGTFGEFGCFSFHPRKIITTGEGGLIVTNDNKLAKKVKALRNHGISYKGGKVDFIAAGLNYRMTEFQAVLGIKQLEEIENFITQRIETANTYNDKLKKFNCIKIPHVYQDRKMVYQTYHLLLGEDVNREELVDFLKAKGVETNIGSQALPCLTYYKKKYKLKKEKFSNSVMVYGKGVALPIGKHLGNDDIQLVIKHLKSYLVGER
jgi:dTDP-4-amino-4,6-dideoxygalactose transaminase